MIVLCIIVFILNCFKILAQASTGPQGVLGPTKIYLAVQPSGAETVNAPNSQPPPLAPVQHAVTPQVPIQENKFQQSSVLEKSNTSPIQQHSVAQQVCSISTNQPQSKVVVQSANQVEYY